MTSEDRKELLVLFGNITEYIEKALVKNDFDGYPFRLTVWQLSSDFTDTLEKIEIDTRENQT
jgi:hypothetical protein